MRICLDTNAYSALGRGIAGAVRIIESADEVNDAHFDLGSGLIRIGV